ncbi:hypothetical protein PT279_09020 [Bifidobacterium sp. ESL0784]|uniref:hypothetical protein n=1 Tax=Bifidobacterium sp. ESL0784 TaxID=2983231 RepID=UPI0023F9B21A|nr:hypothetical protein [Bifidobacterium sp. ESL0784]MDF7641723.1 hypothetical protein [Bifidobacterium sp. ESL0784]
MLVADAQEYYKLELDNRNLLEQRPWPWLVRRAIGLIGVNGRLRRTLEAEQKEMAHG